MDEKDELEIDFDKGEVFNKTKKESYKVTKFPEFMQNLINSGGLMATINSKNK